MKFGVARHGPRAPLTFQFGKNDVFTSTGTPVRETWNRTLSSPLRMWDTVTAGSARRSTNDAVSLVARIQVAGPPAVRGRSRSRWSPNHAVDAASHCFGRVPSR